MCIQITFHTADVVSTTVHCDALLRNGCTISDVFMGAGLLWLILQIHRLLPLLAEHEFRLQW